MASIKFENIGFNQQDAAAKPVKQFVAEQKHLGLSEKELKEVHAKCVAAEKKHKQSEGAE